MKTSTLKRHLSALTEINILTPDGSLVPPHFHITEAGLMTKHFIDCGGTIRTEKYLSMQIWIADDREHRLSPRKLLGILEKAAPLMGNEDLEVEIEHQQGTIGRYGLAFNGVKFELLPKHTDCLAKELCGITEPMLTPLQQQQVSCCSPGDGCC